jgi:hypothetical protein
MTALHFLASGCESMGSSGLEDGRWERATEEGKIKRTGVRDLAARQRSRNLCLHIGF